MDYVPVRHTNTNIRVICFGHGHKLVLEKKSQSLSFGVDMALSNKSLNTLTNRWYDQVTITKTNAGMQTWQGVYRHVAATATGVAHWHYYVIWLYFNSIDLFSWFFDFNWMNNTIWKHFSFTLKAKKFQKKIQVHINGIFVEYQMRVRGFGSPSLINTGILSLFSMTPL